MKSNEKLYLFIYLFSPSPRNNSILNDLRACVCVYLMNLRPVCFPIQ